MKASGAGENNSHLSTYKQSVNHKDKTKGKEDFTKDNRPRTTDK